MPGLGSKRYIRGAGKHCNTAACLCEMGSEEAEGDINKKDGTVYHRPLEILWGKNEATQKVKGWPS